MLQVGPAVKVTIHLNRDTGARRGFLADELLAFLQEQRIEGATLIQAHAGYGAHRHLHTVGAGDVAGLHLPVILYFVEDPTKFESIRDRLLELVTDGLVEVHPTTVLKNAAFEEKVIS
jgi:uncharacterized protein